MRAVYPLILLANPAGLFFLDSETDYHKLKEWSLKPISRLEYRKQINQLN